MDLIENYHALTIAILSETYCTPEEAFERLDRGLKLIRLRDAEKTNTIDIINLRTQGIKLQDIADMYGVTRSAICHRIKRFQRQEQSNYG